MTTLQDQQVLFERLKLKLSINRYLYKWGRQYVSQLMQIKHCKDAAFLKSVIDEMAAEGMLTKEISSNGALIVVYRQMEVSCPNS